MRNLEEVSNFHNMIKKIFPDYLVITITGSTGKGGGTGVFEVNLHNGDVFLGAGGGYTDGNTGGASFLTNLVKKFNFSFTASLGWVTQNAPSGYLGGRKQWISDKFLSGYSVDGDLSDCGVGTGATVVYDSDTKTTLSSIELGIYTSSGSSLTIIRSYNTNEVKKILVKIINDYINNLGKIGEDLMIEFLDIVGYPNTHDRNYDWRTWENWE